MQMKMCSRCCGKENQHGDITYSNFGYRLCCNYQHCISCYDYQGQVLRKERKMACSRKDAVYSVSTWRLCGDVHNNEDDPSQDTAQALYDWHTCHNDCTGNSDCGNYSDKDRRNYIGLIKARVPSHRLDTRFYFFIFCSRSFFFSCFSSYISLSEVFISSSKSSSPGFCEA